MAEHGINVELLREDLGIPYVVDLADLTKKFVDKNIVNKRYNSLANEVKAGRFLNDCLDDVKICLTPKNEELKEVIGDLSTVSKKDCFYNGIKSITGDFFGRSSSSEKKDYFDLINVDLINERIDNKLELFGYAMCNNDTLHMAKSLQLVTCMTTMHKYLQDKIIDNVYIDAIVSQMKKENKLLTYQMEQPKFRNKEIELKVKEVLAPKFEELEELKEKIFFRDKLRENLESYNKEGIEKHMKGEMPYQKEVITNLRNKIKEIEMIRAKYIKEDTKNIEKARTSLISRYQIKTDSVEQSAEI